MNRRVPSRADTCRELVGAGAGMNEVIGAGRLLFIAAVVIADVAAVSAVVVPAIAVVIAVITTAAVVVAAAPQPAFLPFSGESDSPP